MSAVVYQWDKLPVDHPIPLLDRRRVIGEKMMISQVTLYPGCDVASHQHENEQIALVMSGRVRFGLGVPRSSEFHEVVVSAGEVIQLPANLPHSAHALEKTEILDLFSPPSQGTGIDRQKNLGAEA